MSRLMRCDVCGSVGADPVAVPQVVLVVDGGTAQAEAQRKARIDVCEPCMAAIWAIGAPDTLAPALRHAWAARYPTEAP